MAGPSFRLVVLLGDPFLIEERRKSLIDEYTSVFKDQLSVFQIRLADLPLDQILGQSRALPFLTQYQILIIRDADRLKEKQTAVLEGYLKNPPAFCTLIFEAEELEKSHPLLEYAGTHGELIRFDDKSKKSSAGKVLRDRLRASGKTMSTAMMERLEASFGEAPQFLESYLAQLVNLAGSDKEITEAMIEQVEERWDEVDIFKFADAILSRKTEAALQGLERLLQENEDFTQLLGFLHWKFKQFWIAKKMQSQGEPEAAVLKACKVYPKQAPFFMRQLRAASLQDLERALEGLFQLDWKLKSGRAQGNTPAEVWLVETTMGKK